MRAHSRGFTLIELMITVAIVAILAAVAYPSYLSQVRRGKRTEAKVELMKAAQALEKCFTNTYKYSSCTGINNGGTKLVGSTLTSYAFSAPVADNDDDDFLIVATAAGAQAADEDCSTFSIDERGTKSAKTKGGADNTASCWR